ncbi:MAG: hypothetical protein CFE21_18235 [Bacteroidetes bacterium B1(2017)]|nr:MAG: hypothetical protein CFE21_18235 [Bacteroidetes bacterium B1(2017)]
MSNNRLFLINLKLYLFLAAFLVSFSLMSKKVINSNEFITPKISQYSSKCYILEWGIKKNASIDYFLIQISRGDGRFINIGQIMKKGKTHFQFKDKYRPYNKIHYRLITVFKNGNFIISPSEMIKNNTAKGIS